MATRSVYGNTISENGWPMVDEGSCQWVSIPGTDVTLEIQVGQPLQIMRAFAADFHVYVQPLRDADSACWTLGNDVDTSNHLSGTAMDLDWDDHPFHARGTFNAAQMAALRDLLGFYEGTIYWGGDWSDPIDEMHFQMGYGTYGNPATADFVTRKIRADGYSTYRRGTGPDAAQILSDVMGGSFGVDRYRQLLPAYSQCLRACDCTTPPRIAMNVAELGHESMGLYYSEEIASGAAYEGRTELGNTQPGDGVRFKGRSWIQITGRTNYTRLSQWAFDKGLVPTPTFFVDQPEQLAADQYAGLGAAWYWVVARPDINTLSDARDIETVSIRINGFNPDTGRANGIDDRINRYNRALGLGDQLLTLLSGAGSGEDDDFMSALSADEQREMLQLLRITASTRFTSRSGLRRPGEGDTETVAGFTLNTDGNVHILLVEKLAVEYGDPASIALLYQVATQTDPARADDAALARRILAKVDQDKAVAAYTVAARTELNATTGVTV